MVVIVDTLNKFERQISLTGKGMNKLKEENPFFQSWVGFQISKYNIPGIPAFCQFETV